MSREHVIDPRIIHHDWDETLPAILEVESGDVIHFDLLEAGNRQVKPGDHFEDVTFDFDTMYNLSGPVAVVGAEPGDTLCIDVLDLEHGTWGWSAILPGFGLLPDDFPSGYVRTFDLAGKDAADFGNGIAIPLRPFMGTMGVNPGGGVRLSPFPPHAGGGNIDNRHLTSGSRLYLPVFLNTALFSCGDPHGVQGDGEVCVSALEAPLKGSLRLTLLKRSISTPAFVTAPRRADSLDAGSDYCTMGIAPDLMEGCRIATRAMIAWLGEEHGLSPEDAFVLCSLAGKLKILEVVDAGMWNVGMCMPLGIFPDGVARQAT
jgi:acetamidase/formamidase